MRNRFNNVNRDEQCFKKYKVHLRDTEPTIKVMGVELTIGLNANRLHNFNTPLTSLKRGIVTYGTSKLFLYNEKNRLNNKYLL